MSNQNYLFSGNYLTQVLNAHRQSIKKEVDQLSDTLIFSEDSSNAVDTVYQKIAVALLEVDFNKAEMLPEKEIEKEYVSMFGDRAGYRKATRIDVLVPFSGDKGLFELRPSKFTTVLPTGEIKGNDLRLRFEYFSPDPNYNLKKNYEDEVKLIRTYVDWANEDVENFNQDLKGSILGTLNRRKEELETSRAKISELGLQIRKPTQNLTENAIQDGLKRKVVFSEDCRHVDITKNGQKTSEDFTPAQAQVIKYLCEQQKKGLSKCHYKEVLRHVETNATRLQDVFKISRNKRTSTHSLFGPFIKNDRKGNYWLDL